MRGYYLRVVNQPAQRKLLHNETIEQLKEISLDQAFISWVYVQAYRVTYAPLEN